MTTTYNKPTVEATVKTLSNYEVTFTDGKDATVAMKAKDIIKGEADGKEVIIPFHAVKKFTEKKGTKEETKADAYC